MRVAMSSKTEFMMKSQYCYFNDLPLLSLYVNDNDLRQEPASFAPFPRVVMPDF